MTGPAIDLEEVHLSFDGTDVLSGINLSVGAGSSTVIFGPSGTGKTVLLKTIAGVYEPMGGVVRIEGQPKSGMLFQKSGLFDSLPVWENIAFRWLQAEHVTRKQGRDLAIEKLAQVGLAASEADLFPNELSGGMQKRVGIARAIADDPDVLLLDEPTAGLDPIMSNIINDLIIDIVARLGVTVISVNSDMVGAKRTAQTGAMLYGGKIIWTGPTETMHSSGNPYVDQFVNSRAEGPIPTIIDPRRPAA